MLLNFGSSPQHNDGATVSAGIALLGVLTIVAYGSWYYGFGVLVGDISRDPRSPDRTMAIGFGLANILTGVLGALAGRSLDRHGVRRIFLAVDSSGADCWPRRRGRVRRGRSQSSSALLAV